MTIDSFNHLSLPEQNKALSKHGIHLLQYGQENIKCEVYKLFEFYVKLRYEFPKKIQNKKSTPQVFAFTNTDEFHLHEHHIFALLGEG
jgi:hypothetical protein